MQLKKGAWVYIPVFFSLSDYSKMAEDLAEIGFNEVYLIVSSGNGTLYPSKVRTQRPELKGKDVVTPLIKELKKREIEVHAWIVSLNFHNQEFFREHKDWYVVNKNGVSCLDEPPYVNHYKWLCPSREEVRENLKSLFLEVAERFDVDGLHFDYIRLPDILLPKALRKNYEGVPEEDVLQPRFDYCYCKVCREKFMKKYGVDPLELKYIDPLYGKWFKWRSDRITSLVKEVSKAVKNYDNSLKVSAAVFATPKLAYEYVFQNWTIWRLDWYNPMIYHEMYGEPSTWIGDAVREASLRGVDVCAGILVKYMRSREETINAFKLAKENGGVGVTVFVYPFARAELRDWVKDALRELKEED